MNPAPMTDHLKPLSERRTTDEDGHDLIEPLYVGIVTVSSSRDASTDPGGDLAEQLVTDAGDEVTAREVVSDDYSAIQSVVGSLIRDPHVDCIVTTGGTGVTIDDVTPTACKALFDRELPGFGELFRMISYDIIGHRAMASRATGGIAGDTPIFCLPGSTGAVEDGLTELILPEAPHLRGLATRHREDHA